MNKAAARWLTLIVLSVVVLVAKAYLPLPILWRGIEGSGLYRVISAVQFVETAVFTVLVVGVFAFRRWRLGAARSLLLGACCALLNFGLMVVDARLQAFPHWIEDRILRRFGPAAGIYAIALLAIVAGLLLTYLLLARSPAAAGGLPRPEES